MAKALITLTWCDRHLTDKDEEVPASPMPEMQGWNLDLCSDCSAPLLESLALYERYGAKGKRTPQMTTRPVPKRPDKGAEGPFPCPAEGCGSVLANRDSLGSHVRQIHGKSVGELEGQPLDHQCPDCDRAFTTAVGLSGHVRAAHGIPGKAKRSASRAAGA